MLKKSIKILTILILVIFSTTACSCGNKKAELVYVAKENETINTGGSKTIKLYNNDEYDIVWKSSDENIAIVDKNGEVYAKKEGKVVITAKTSDGSQKVSVNVNVTKTKNQVTKIDIKGDSISLNVAAISLQVNQQRKIDYTVNPETVDNKEIAWKSRNNRVATVTTEGIITAVKEGKTTIVGTAKDGSGKTAQLIVEVTSQVFKIESLTMNRTSLSIKPNSVTQLRATIKPFKVTNKALNWSSSDTNIATVDANGKVTTLKEGTTIIRVASTDGTNQVATCGLTVTNKASTNGESTGGNSSNNGTKTQVFVSSISLSQSDILLGLDDSKIKVKATVYPLNAKNKRIMWTSSNEKVATVNSSGQISPIGIGNAIITVTAVDGSGTKATLNVTVNKLSNNKKYVDNIILDKTNIILSSSAKNYTIGAKIFPSNADNKKLIWTSSNERVVEVNSSGKLTAIGAGNATITVKSQDTKGTSAVASVTVVKGVDSVTLSEHSQIDMIKGNEKVLTAAVAPEDAGNKVIEWTSSNTDVAMVDQNGKITAVDKGNATITATATDGSGKKDSIKVKVVWPVQVSKITLSTTDTKIVPGSQTQIVASISPDNAANKTITWSSSDENIVFVNENGLITGKNIGEATITAKANDETGKTAKIDVEVIASIQASSVTLPKAVDLGTICLGQSKIITATVKPDIAKFTANINWSLKDASYGTVTQTAYFTTYTTGTKIGTINIYAQAKDGGKASKKKASTSIKVVKDRVTGATFSKANVSLGIGGIFNNPIITIAPDCATKKNIVWETDNNKPKDKKINPQVATVSPDGTITAQALGTINICAKFNTNSEIINKIAPECYTKNKCDKKNTSDNIKNCKEKCDAAVTYRICYKLDVK